MMPIVQTVIVVALSISFSSAQAAKRDETEGMAGMSGDAKKIYSQTDKKAAQRPGQTINVKPIPPAKGGKPEEKVTKGEETAGTAPGGTKKTEKK